jgi:hypothetical protein
VIERVAAAATLGDDSIVRESKALNALDDVIGHSVDHKHLYGGVSPPKLELQRHRGVAARRDAPRTLAARMRFAFYGCDDDTSHSLGHWRYRSEPCTTGSHNLVVRLPRLLHAPVWKHVLVLVTGAVLAPGKRT